MRHTKTCHREVKETSKEWVVGLHRVRPGAARPNQSQHINPHFGMEMAGDSGEKE
jgi:hypothetical protein